MNYRFIFISLAAVLLLAAGPAWAAQPLGLNSFVKDTPAIADSVNFNFTTLEKAIPVMWASIDNDPAAVAFTVASLGAEINSLVDIIVPEPGGILLINGSVFVNNDSANPLPYTLNPLIDGIQPEGHSFMSYLFSDGQGPPGTAEAFTLSYTYATAVAASTYTVSQELKPVQGYGPALFTFNKNNLTVIFFPSLPGGAPINNPGIPAGAHTFIPPACEDGDLCP